MGVLLCGLQEPLLRGGRVRDGFLERKDRYRKKRRLWYLITWLSLSHQPDQS